MNTIETPLAMEMQIERQRTGETGNIQLAFSGRGVACFTTA